MEERTGPLTLREAAIEAILIREQDTAFSTVARIIAALPAAPPAPPVDGPGVNEHALMLRRIASASAPGTDSTLALLAGADALDAARPAPVDGPGDAFFNEQIAGPHIYCVRCDQRVLLHPDGRWHHAVPVSGPDNDCTTEVPGVRPERIPAPVDGGRVDVTTLPEWAALVAAIDNEHSCASIRRRAVKLAAAADRGDAA